MAGWAFDCKLRWAVALATMLAAPVSATPVLDGSASVLQVGLAYDTFSGPQALFHISNGDSFSGQVERPSGHGSSAALADLQEGKLGVAAARWNQSPATPFAAARARIVYSEFVTFAAPQGTGSAEFSVALKGSLFAGAFGNPGDAWAVLGTGVEVWDVTGVADPLVQLPFGGDWLYANGTQVACARTVFELRLDSPVVGQSPCATVTRQVADGAVAEVALDLAGSATVEDGHRYLFMWTLQADAMSFDDGTSTVVDSLHTASFSLDALNGVTVVNATGPLLGPAVVSPVPAPATLWLVLLAAPLLRRTSAQRSSRAVAAPVRAACTVAIA